MSTILRTVFVVLIYCVLFNETRAVFTPLSWENATEKAKEFTNRLNLTEKTNIVTGNFYGGSCIGNIAPIERVSFGGICFQDGPTALRLADKASVFPAGLTAAASWDKTLIRQRGIALAEEFRGKGAHVLQGPVAGPLGHQPLGGRNWEGFSPDPYLTGVAMFESIQGIQSVGVQAVAKHYIGNEQQTHVAATKAADGAIVEAYSANIDDRTLHELYLWPFADSVRAQVASVMCSYNRVNETYACQNDHILNQILKKELGFDGYVVSDFFATTSGVPSALGGLDLNMPGPINESTTISYYGTNLVQAVENGSVAASRLDDMVRRVLTPYFYLKQDEDYPTSDPLNKAILGFTYGIFPAVVGTPSTRDVRTPSHTKLIRELGSAGTVLLKNVNRTLPLGPERSIGIFGNDAILDTWGSYYSGTSSPEFGTLAVGGGSGSGRFTNLVSPLEAIKARVAVNGTRVIEIIDNAKIADGALQGAFPMPEHCLVFLKTWGTELADRTSFEPDWNSTQVVENVASLCPSTIVITHSAGLTTMPWAQHPNITAILAAHLPGEQSGNSLVDILYGDVNPSGKLPYTIAKDGGDYPSKILNITGVNASNSDAWQDNYNDGLLIDYRHFDARNITPQFEFGFGLSYTSFNLSSAMTVSASAKQISAYPPAVNQSAPGGNPHLYETIYTVSTQVTNTGPVAGATVVQLYLSFASASVPEGTPLRSLRGFDKVYLEPGQTKTVKMLLTRRDLSYWEVTKQEWRIPEGEALVSIGFSSRDIHQEEAVQLSG